MPDGQRVRSVTGMGSRIVRTWSFVLASSSWGLFRLPTSRRAQVGSKKPGASVRCSALLPRESASAALGPGEVWIQRFRVSAYKRWKETRSMENQIIGNISKQSNQGIMLRKTSLRQIYEPKTGGSMNGLTSTSGTSNTSDMI